MTIFTAQLSAAWVALFPLAAYFIWLAWAHVRRRPLAVSGAFDAAVLAAAVSGLAIVGPLALVMPVTGGAPWSWPVVALLCVLAVAICVLVSRPRLVVYNITVEQLRPLVAEVVAALDPQARWAGESAALPGRGFQVHVEGNGPLRTVSIVNVGERSSPEGWGEFSRRLRGGLRGLRVRRSPWAPVFAGLGLIVAGAAIAASSIPAWRQAVDAAAVPAAPRRVPFAAPPAPFPESQSAPGASHAPARRPVRA
jgi:hypothetical protein